MAALLSLLGQVTVWALLALGPVMGGLKVYKAVKAEQHAEQVRKTATTRSLGQKTYRL